MPETMMDKALNEYAAKPDNRNLSAVILTIVVKAQEDFKDCPFCDVAIGALSHHWNEACPFTNLERLLRVIR